MDNHTRGDVRRPTLPTSSLDPSSEDNLFDSDLQSFLDIVDLRKETSKQEPDYYAILGLPRSVCCDTRTK